MTNGEKKPMLELVGVSKSYGATRVLNGFSYAFGEGKIIGLLGPNGCGKSTIMKLVTGLLTTDAGRIYVCGRPVSYKTNALVSYLPERTYFNPAMTVRELIKFFRDFYPDFRADVARRMLRELGIAERSRLRTLSKGNKEKVQLIMVMSRRARLYLLDEPIAGVDPAARDYILRTIVSNYNPGATVIITTHLIHDIEQTLDEFVFMGYGGQVLLAGDAKAVREKRGKTLDEIFREVFRC